MMTSCKICTTFKVFALNYNVSRLFSLRNSPPLSLRSSALPLQLYSVKAEGSYTFMLLSLYMQKKSLFRPPFITVFHI